MLGMKYLFDECLRDITIIIVENSKDTKIIIKHVCHTPFIFTFIDTYCRFDIQ